MGGGFAEMLRSMLCHLLDAGSDARWIGAEGLHHGT